MIKDIRFGFSIIKCALDYDGIITVFLLSVGASVFCSLLMPIPVISAVLAGVGTIGIVSSIYSASISIMVQSSPYKKKLRTTIPAYFALISLLVSNTMSIGIHGISYLRIKDNTDPLLSIVYDSKTYASSIVVSIVILLMILFYVAMANIFYWQSSVVFIAIFIWWRFLSNEPMDLIVWEISTETAIILSYVIVCVGSGSLYILNCLLYKYQYSELSVRNIVKRATR